ncbi:arsenate reductase (azurin) small subunit [Cytobacillus firmus]|uniref:Arsenate reductase (Azurin) small subunit n=1 Tax=Cytobacillus firmus TaxID=1399 RepID=A0AA46P981_CYTFI|nr:arsenate reductase (azurin) small subunit [Cytobacillus firmus]UYG98239.1 arsenate reductase (azurin) small subunit [Cytobacillus firmus]
MEQENHQPSNERDKDAVLISRRRTVKAIGGGLAALGVAYLTGCTPSTRNTMTESVRTPNPTNGYPIVKIAELSSLKIDQPISFEYPLRGQVNLLIDLGKKVENGIGPSNSIVAYNQSCQHMGCPATYNSERKTLFCPCHQTTYDPSFHGTVVVGQGKAALPRIELKIENDSIYAIGVKGLIYGYRNNLLDGEYV